MEEDRCPDGCIRYTGKKKYPLEPESLRECDGGWFGGTLAIFSKGHHGEDEFLGLGEVQDFLTKLRSDENSNVQWDWWRCVPEGEAGIFLYRQAVPRSRGAFPVTYVGDY